MLPRLQTGERRRGSYQATRLASEVYELLGVKGLQTEDGRTPDEMPAVLEGVMGGHLAWRQHDGGHTDGPNVPAFVEWANGVLRTKFEAQVGEP